VLLEMPDTSINALETEFQNLLKSILTLAFCEIHTYFWVTCCLNLDLKMRQPDKLTQEDISEQRRPMKRRGIGDPETGGRTGRQHAMRLARATTTKAKSRG
jgi:hypothetical protein